MSRPIRLFEVGWRRNEWGPLLEASKRIELRRVELSPRIAGSAFPLLFARALRSAVRFRPDLVLVESIGPEGLLGPILRRVLGVPYALRLRGDPWEELRDRGAEIPWRDRLVKGSVATIGGRLARQADAILPISMRGARRVEEEIGRGAVCRPVPNPALRLDRPPVDLSAGPTPPLLSVTNFHFRAKIRPLVEAIRQLAPLLAERRIEWTILGKGWFLDSCREEVRAISPQVRLVGWADAEAQYARGALLLHFSALDGLPNVLLEGAAAGLPVVVNRGSPFDEFVLDGVNALAVDLGRPGELPAAVGRLLDDPPFRQRLGRSARCWAESRLSRDRVGREVEEALEACVEGARPG